MCYYYAKTQEKLISLIFDLGVDTGIEVYTMGAIKTRQSSVSENGRDVQRDQYLVLVKSTGFD